MTEKLTPLYWKTHNFGIVEIPWEEVEQFGNGKRIVLNRGAERDETDRNGEEPWDGIWWLARKFAMLASIDPDSLKVKDVFELLKKLQMSEPQMIGYSRNRKRNLGYVFRPDADERIPLDEPTGVESWGFGKK